MLYNLLLPFMRGMPHDVRVGVREWGDFVFYAGIALIGARFMRRRRGGQNSMGAALILRKFMVDEAAPDGQVVQIVGRNAGVIGWLLTTIGLGAETSLTLNNKDITFKSANLSGQLHQLVPLPSVSSTHCGFFKPVAALIIGIFFLVAGVVLGVNESGGGFIISLIVGGVLLAYYWLSKSMLIQIETVGGMQLGMRFKPSVTDGVSVDITKVLQAIQLINMRAVASHGIRGALA